MFIGRHVNIPDNFKSPNIGKHTYKIIKKYLDNPIKVSKKENHLNIKTIKYPTTLQVFIGPKLSFSGKNISQYMNKKYITKIRKLIKKRNIKLVAHNTYLIQLTRTSKIIPVVIANELHSIKLLGGLGVVAHLGSVNMKKDRKRITISLEEATDNVINNAINIIKRYIKINPKDKNPPKLFIETSAGKGGEISYKIPDLAKIYKRIKQKLSKNQRNMIKICMDTCHMFSAGYDFRSGKKTLKILTEVNKLIGLQNVGVIHLNDSSFPLDSRTDCHANIGCGYIGNRKLGGSLDGFRVIILIAKKYKIPMILETPSNGKCIPKKSMEELAVVNAMGTDIQSSHGELGKIGIKTDKKVINNNLKNIPINLNNNIYYSLINYC